MAPELLGGRYELRGVLGRGGMAEVRDAWDTRLDRAVAIKLLHPGLSVQAESRRRFEAEAKSAAALSHPHVVAVHDSGEHRGTPYMVMERLPGRTLADLIADGPLPQLPVRRMLDQVLAALAVAHDAGILHRDIKPGNILLSEFGEAKVADFGIAKSAEVDQTVTGHIVGTIAYVSPDRLAGRPACVGDDLYALGVLGYEALTGRRPFLNENIGALARAIMDERPPAIAELRPDVDPLLAAVIGRAMARAPEQRFASARAMAAALAGRGAALMPTGVRPPTMVLASPLPPMPAFEVPRKRPPRRSRKVLAVVAVLLAIAVVALAFAVDSAPGSRGPEAPAVNSSTPPTTPISSPPPSPPVSSLSPVEVPGNGNKHRGGKGRGNEDGD